MSNDISLADEKSNINWTKIIFLLVGVFLFIIVYISPPWPDAIDPMGKHFALSKEAKGALAVFLLAGTWWVFEVVPIGVTSLAIGVLQAAFSDPIGKKWPLRISWYRRSCLFLHPLSSAWSSPKWG